MSRYSHDFCGVTEDLPCNRQRRKNKSEEKRQEIYAFCRKLL